MSVWASFEFDDHEQVCFFSDEKTGLRAIVAIHSTFLGPAIGGTRFKTYDGDSFAIPPRTVHSVKNTGGGALTMLSTYVVEQGQPIASPAP